MGLYISIHLFIHLLPCLHLPKSVIDLLHDCTGVRTITCIGQEVRKGGGFIHFQPPYEIRQYFEIANFNVLFLLPV